MKVKSCYLVKLAKSEDEVKEFTENYKCTVRHRLVSKEGTVVYTIEDATGNKSVITIFPESIRTQLKNDCGVRVVVDNIYEGIEFFKAQGYETVYSPIENESNYLCAMTNGSEYRFLFEHKKKHS